MDFSEFKQRVQESTPSGTILKDPGGGTLKILSNHSDEVKYRRRNSPIKVFLRDLFDGYNRFNGGIMTTNDLKGLNPSVFDSEARPKGHSCNCTLLFLFLQRIGVVTQIKGHGARSNPFYVDLRE
jgi:hypothetical protein